MKNLEFLENDYRCPASDEDIRRAKRRLRRSGFDLERIDGMNINYQIHLMDDNELSKILFNKDNILVTYSVYIQGSDSQFMYFSEQASNNGIKHITYLDMSGALPEFLNDNLRNEDNIETIINGINTNTILTYNYEDDSLKRVKINFVNKYGDCVVLEDFNISEL
jgi:hypothetical protein